MIPTLAVAIVNTIFLLVSIFIPQNGQQNPGKETWVGKKIIPTKHPKDIRFGDVVKGKDQIYELQCITNNVVEREYLDWVRTDDGFHRGWIHKKDLVTLDRAVDYWSDRIEQKSDEEIGYFMRGLSWMALREYAKAIDDFKEYYRINAWDLNALVNMGICQYHLKNRDDAIGYFDEYLKVWPDHRVALAHRARSWFEKGEFQRAHDDFRKAQPKMMSAGDHRDYAWMLATTPVDSLRDGKQALELMKLIEPRISQRDFWIYYNTLAACQAECGDFEAAIQSQMTAIAMIPYTTELKLKWRSMYYPRLVKYLCYEPHRAMRGDDSQP